MHATVASADDRVLPCRPTLACTADLAPPGTLELEVGVQLRREDGGNGVAIAPDGDYVDSVVGGVKLHVPDQLGQRPSVAVTIAASVTRMYDLFATAHAASYPITAKLSATVEPHYYADAAPAAPRDAGAIAEYVIADHRSVTGLAGVSIAPVRLWGRN